MIAPRFFAPDAGAGDSTIALPDEEARHLVQVLRLRTGDAVRVFDGRGREWQAVVERIERRGVWVMLGEEVAGAPEPRTRITLAAAILKGDRMDEVVRDAVMLGVAAIQPVIAARTEISAAAVARSGRAARWQRVAVASAKQCGRARLPVIHPPSTLDEVCAGDGLRLMLVEPSTRARGVSLRDVPSSASATLLIGPEGGWTGDEVETAAARGAILLTLGSQTLRADAAPIVALTALRVHWGDL